MGMFKFSFSKEKSIKEMNNLYSQNSDISIEKLIEGNLDLVKKIAWQIHGRVHNVIEIEDLIQQGMEGLVHAAQKYSPRDNVTFPQYAQLRIRGSIIDYLRKNSNLCRTTIKKKQDFEKNKIQLENSLGRPPSQDEIVKSLGISFDEYDYWQKSFEANSVQSLDNAYDEYSLLFATSEENPEEQLETKELKAEIKVALETLNQREALIAQLYYVEELNIYEISDILDISTGRISQIKKRIIEKLRNEIKK
jgi:RNA polymerase sigma factor for flagellar operon FliA